MKKKSFECYTFKGFQGLSRKLILKNLFNIKDEFLNEWENESYSKVRITMEEG